MTSWNIPSGTTFLISLFIRQQDLFGLAETKAIVVGSVTEIKVNSGIEIVEPLCIIE